MRFKQHSSSFHYVINTFAWLKGSNLLHKTDQCERGFKKQLNQSYARTNFADLEVRGRVTLNILDGLQVFWCHNVLENKFYQIVPIL